jgi:hypothetical protein
LPAVVSDAVVIPQEEQRSAAGGCTNCASPTIAKFCADCGEKQPDHHDLTVGHFVHEVFHELAHFDGKLFHTLRLLVLKPGQLTVDHFGGRRTRHIGPVRLFILAFALQALLFSLSPRTAMFDLAKLEAAKPEIAHAVQKIAHRAHQPVPQVREQLNAKWSKFFKLLELVQIVLAALVLKAVYRRRFLSEHLVFSAHFLALMYFWMAVTYPIRWEVGLYNTMGSRVMGWVGGAVLASYLALAMRRFYERGEKLPWVRAIAGYAGIMLAFGILQMLIITSAVFLVLQHA